MELDFDVVSLPESDHPEAGETAPAFTRPLVNDEFWEDRSLDSLLANGPVLLVFTTMNGAFPATYTWNELRERDWEADYDVSIVGVTVSDPYDTTETIRDRGIDYPIFSDPQNGVAEQFGVVHDLDGMTGVTEPRPSVFLLDTDRTVEYAWVAAEWPDFPPYDEIEAELPDA
ncbi:redoxin domain-containing protein [Halorubellus sp. JP-L1]|uniref:redoxin domain-containing protein n=1 Tax=Halorubellus sp. JP-L1 TaxID=2715753 RepID=UPI00140B1B0B|nr:redoxin domain-containing protein [Halorubellus sp. JP-L1]NHN43585.1 redoxin domain-containing protein [Halorubellus sp. JP-L1]